MLLPWLPLVLVTCVLGFFTLRIANKQKEIAAEAKRVAQAKLKLDLFDRRMSVFQSAWGLLSFALQMRYDDEYHEALKVKRIALQNQLPEALFLFGTDVFEYLKKVVLELLMAEVRWQRTKGNGGVLPHELIEEDHAYCLWVGTEAGTGVRDRFSPFLDFSAWH